MTDTGAAPDTARVLLVTGVSGAGKTTALKGLEDLGYEAVDNVPISLLERLVAPGGETPALAIGVDIRTRDFDARAFLGKIGSLAGRADLDVSLLFIDCHDDILVRRFEETRRRHPLAADRPVSDGIREERALMAPLRRAAEVHVDTSAMNPGDMKILLESHFRRDTEPGMTTVITSFGFKNGAPRDADLVFDVRFLRNPHYVEELRPQTGRDPAVAAYVTEDEGFQPFLDNLTALLDPLMPRYAAEGKSYLTIAVGCTGGRHRSVVTCERLSQWMTARGHRVHLRHRDLEKPVK
ncbi:MAG: RNase adapter RapZ [Magnetovibrio sp.]|nr:RNase adapter RapZ [Magnetovibrio sp.]